MTVHDPGDAYQHALQMDALEQELRRRIAENRRLEKENKALQEKNKALEEKLHELELWVEAQTDG